ncbi:hypothetical protein [Cohnella boryungensis]|uniref:Uncharacterized protein n=1 Tax=Cohnella boryungensis TaxID=768479 RepID=A0ABV8S8Z8_9BACL
MEELTTNAHNKQISLVQKKSKLPIILSSIALVLSLLSFFITKATWETLAKRVTIIDIAQKLENGTVTDDFFLNRASFNVTGDNKEAKFDLLMQPSMAKKYMNRGQFDLPDQEVKNKMISLIDIVKDYYVASNGNKIVQWDTISIIVTVHNHEIGTYKNGSVTLKGE